MKGINFIAVAILLILTARISDAQTSAFTYQGRFTDGGTAANGTYDMQFKLFDSPTVGAGNQIGSTITGNGVVVTNGVFTVLLNYGSTPFSGADRFLEIGVRPAGSPDPYTILSPRQVLSSAVYAIRAGSTTTADNATQLGGVEANQYVQTNDSRLTDARTPAAGSANYIQNTLNQQTANFHISGNGTLAGTLYATTVNSSTSYNIAGGRVLSLFGSNNTFLGWNAGPPAAVGSENSFFGQGSGQASTGQSNSFFGYRSGTATLGGSYNAFFGANAGAANTTAFNNAFFGQAAGFKNTQGHDNTFLGNGAGLNNLTANGNTFVGSLAGQAAIDGGNNTFVGANSANSNLPGSGNTYLGANTDGAANLTNATAIGANAFANQSNSLILGSINGVNGASADTSVGIGTTAPTEKLTIKTLSNNYGLMHTDGTVKVGTWVGGGNGNPYGGWIGTRSNHPLNFFTGGGGAAMTLETSGYLTLNNVDAGGNLNLCLGPSNHISFCSSSLRYKTNIQPFAGGLSVLNRLRPITFDWKQGGMHDLGFGAEDIAAVEPLLVTRNDKGEVEGVKYDRITAVLVNAVKEQQEQIKQQQSEIAALKSLVCKRNRRAPVCK